MTREQAALSYALLVIPPLANDHLTPWRVSWSEHDEIGEEYSLFEDFETQKEAVAFEREKSKRKSTCYARRNNLSVQRDIIIKHFLAGYDYKAQNE